MSSGTNPGRSPMIPVQPKRRDNWWESIDPSSTIVTIVLTSFIFMVGWSYVANWYAYFGIGVDQINIVLQQVFIYSVAPLATALAYGIIAYALYVFVRTVFLRKQSKFEANDWFYVVPVWVAILLFSHPNELADDQMFFLLHENLYVGLFLLSLFLGMVVLFILRNSKPFKSFLEGINPWRWLVLAIFAFVALLYYSASMAILDAHRGFKGIGGEIQDVLLVSNKPLLALQAVEIACVVDGCYYGPFGLILQTDSAFFFALPNKEAPPKFPSKTGLYIVPRSDANGPYFVIPASQEVTSTLSIGQP